ncbi:hypothetical protein [Luteimicrobium subarcticum]|uniref:Prephenate dehydratase n=1 Tax=Luteimicrobium subarcticum TaxID=620910 RepID=A0A2M8WUN4_9MICO|nr:hypothetical protein [Luteimicrobium subarcticum]PJI94633.1 hypothetical protein CLV34_0478 [Luteimicrobium subarcticum]
MTLPAPDPVLPPAPALPEDLPAAPVLPDVPTLLGRTERESGPHARAAAALLGRPDDLLDLGSTTATLETVARLDDLGAVVHLAHPQQPAPELERALLAAAQGVLVTAALPVTRQWVRVGRSGATGGAVVVDEAGMRDCRHRLRSLGASPRLVPTRTPVEERIALAGEHGTLLVERSAVPAGFAVLPESDRLDDPTPLWYGLVERRADVPRPDGPAQVWLAFGPRDDHRGSLQQTLGVVAEAGIDLTHLRSHRSDAGPHVFFSAFSCPSGDALDALVAGFRERGIAHRVLAVLPGESFEPGPLAVEPRWDLAERSAG